MSKDGGKAFLEQLGVQHYPGGEISPKMKFLKLRTKAAPGYKMCYSFEYFKIWETEKHFKIDKKDLACILGACYDTLGIHFHFSVLLLKNLTARCAREAQEWSWEGSRTLVP